MELLDVSSLPTNKIASHYMKQNDAVLNFFDYPDIENKETYINRLNELYHKTFPRQKLVNYLMEYNKKFTADKETLQNIQKLADEKSVVVIGGQQAGLLTGPLYTIHKIISIISFAKKAEKQLQVPVVPIFWVAGEDHDFAEINHTFVLKNGKIEKRIIGQKVFKKCPASILNIDQQKAKEWIKEVFSTLTETEYTNDLLIHLDEDLRGSKTYVDFFIKIVFRLFKNQGLVIVDSGDVGFRQIGLPFIKMLIKQNDELAKQVFTSQLAVSELGFGEPIEIHEQNAHLFYVKDGDRILLERKNGKFVGKNNECCFTENELLTIAEQNPSSISNNVVTRPLLQEYIFPTLAFIAGPGEVAYWSLLKKAFHLFGLKVPPIVPRLMMSIVDRKTKKYLTEFKLDLEEVLQKGCGQMKEKWFESRRPDSIDKTALQTKNAIKKAHDPLKELAIQIDPGLKDLAEKNAAIIERQIQFLKEKIEKSIRLKYEVEMNKFNHIENSLKPLQAPQERIWNIYYYLNEYGYEFIEQLLHLDYRWNGNHKVIFL
ncbi:bacillithiol biosynthesis cysteine-adding enzyme BshC [Calidifontibacillus erzurumensis]|uniref:Putative cysteine ligase BshC n=1 Tax=Calidifontibacillus erzurumensis TaxID=2741433 RepID=A0A8J8KDK0_9BACI|nr:bacillithiol biosynthesis cysteine-adding enzyme BshC [Calidifontibacillus erzurumensis]NSL50770.1 bacillithiol biosynthesis cysteine-adding enzyme BshC [Calidifontibacillus erzurumensis]